MNYRNLPNHIRILNIISSRTNVDDITYTDYNFRVSSHRQIDANEFIPESEYDGTFIYNVWIKDTFDIQDYYLISQFFRPERNLKRENVINEIYNYRRTQEFNTIYAYIHKDYYNSRMFCSNREIQLESLEYICKLFPNHKVIRSDYYSPTYAPYDHRKFNQFKFAMKTMKKGDIFHCFDMEHQGVQASDIIILNRTLENVPFANNERQNIVLNNANQLTLDEVRMLTENNLTMTDREFYYKKITLDTLVLAASERLAENSSLRVLPAHLLREIGRWF
jgi:hypothetical protein